MTLRKLMAATAVAVMAASSMGAEDYMFPSAQPPAGKDTSEVEQYVTFIWDDNAYSGLQGTLITENPVTKVQTDAEWGMSWATRKLAKRGNNPDGKAMSMTFNPTTGQMVEIYKEGGKRVGYDGQIYTTIPFDGSSTQPQDYPVAWGREMGEWGGAVGSGTPDVRPNYLKNIYAEALSDGHEIGNHTIDHMETNSPLPKEYFPDNGNEGYDPFPDADKKWNGDDAGAEANEFWEKCGWDTDAGKKISQSAWAHAIDMGESQLTEHLDLSIADNNLFAFRAPRLEVNSNLYHALAEKGYLYDCGLEEGYEENRDGKNFLWPYTLDNGSPNVWTQKEWGDPKPLESMPAGLWQIPVNVMIVPDEGNMRQDVQDYAIKMAKAGGNYDGYLDDWKETAKVTGFDFNMFVLFGMTGPQVEATLKHTLDLRLQGNKAPMQIGCHTDYFTPIYDDGPLKNDNVYKLALERNKYTDRITAFEGFMDYCIEKEVFVVSGKKLIDEIKKLQESETVGDEFEMPSDVQWAFYQDEVQSTTNKGETIDGATLEAKITLGKAVIPTKDGQPDWDNGKYPASSYACGVKKGSLTGLTHVSFTYNSDAPLVARFHVEDDQPWEVLLYNIGSDVNSGQIPVNAFMYNQYVMGDKESMDLSKITAFEIAPLSTGDEITETNFKVSNIKTYGAKIEKGVGIVSNKSVATSNLSINSLAGNKVALNVPTTGTYNLNVYSVNGRVIRSFNNQSLTSGINTFDLAGISSGMYMVKVTGQNKSLVSNLLIK